MKDFFKPEDFRFYGDREDHARDSNRKLNSMIESWPVVWSNNAHGWLENENPTSLKKARLAFIEEIKKECPKHEPDKIPYYLDGKRQGHDLMIPKCLHCGVKLKANWTEV